MGMKRLFKIQRKEGSEWVNISLIWCAVGDERALIHHFHQYDPLRDYARVRAINNIEADLPLFNFCPPFSITRLPC
jgi:hypothetical protein